MKLQISLSTKCNLHCKFCLKEDIKRRFGFVEPVDMDSELAIDIASVKYDLFHICSNRGEALMHPDIDDIIEVAKDSGNIIRFVTNASFKTLDWWKQLGSTFDHKDVVVFPLDGIGNKSHNRHRQSDFYTVLRNIEAFVNAGGRGEWRYILFRHNQHQVETAKKLADNIGVDIVFMNSHTYDNKELKKPTTFHQREECGDFYFPCDHNELYVNVNGYLFPCCFVANVFAHKPLRENHYERELVELFEKEMDMLNLKNSSIEHIKENSQFFKECMKKYSQTCKGACLNWTKNQL